MISQLGLLFKNKVSNVLVELLDGAFAGSLDEAGGDIEVDEADDIEAEGDDTEADDTEGDSVASLDEKSRLSISDATEGEQSPAIGACVGGAASSSLHGPVFWAEKLAKAKAAQSAASSSLHPPVGGFAEELAKAHKAAQSHKAHKAASSSLHPPPVEGWQEMIGKAQA